MSRDQQVCITSDCTNARRACKVVGRSLGGSVKQQTDNGRVCWSRSHHSLMKPPRQANDRRPSDLVAQITRILDAPGPSPGRYPASRRALRQF